MYNIGNRNCAKSYLFIILYLQIIISDVHIRYEGPSVNINKPVACGITISSLKVQAAKKEVV